MKKKLATIAALAGFSMPAAAHSSAAGHHGAEGMLPHVHITGADFIWIAVAIGAGCLLWRTIKKRGENHGPR